MKFCYIYLSGDELIKQKALYLKKSSFVHSDNKKISFTVFLFYNYALSFKGIKLIKRLSVH